MLAVDTSVLVAGLLPWHEHHAAALPALQGGLSEGMALPLPALIESYAVMTRLPAPWRLSAADAASLLTRSFQGRARIVSLDFMDAWPFLHEVVSQAVSGGATYDAHIVACARKAGATRLVTFNRRHFERMNLGPMALIVPTAPSDPAP